MSFKSKIDELFNVDVDDILAEALDDVVTMDNLLEPILDASDEVNDEVDSAYDINDEQDDGIPVYDYEDEDMHFILDVDEVLARIKKARERQEMDLVAHDDETLPDNIFNDLVTDWDDEGDGELNEDRVPSRTLAQLIKKKKVAYKKKKAKISKMGVALFRRKQIIAKRKRRLKRVVLKRKRSIYLRSAKGKRSVKIAKKRQDRLKTQLKGKSMSDIVKIPKIGGILGRSGTSGK